jgi:3-deoxy-manno-octulosonate cytidylyltransferase (CMP-KDO synthetase)
LEKRDADSVFVNWQADQPEMKPAAIVAVVDELLSDSSAAMATLAAEMPSSAIFERLSPHVVKVVMDRTRTALYFSRSPIPWQCESQSPWYRHVGLYAYRAAALRAFAEFPRGDLEARENLEQLRFLEMQCRVRVRVVPGDWVGDGIDTFADYEAFVSRYRARSPSPAFL